MTQRQQETIRQNTEVLAIDLKKLLNPRTRVQDQANHVKVLKGWLKRARSEKSITKWTEFVSHEKGYLDEIKKHVKLGTIDKRTKFIIGVMKRALSKLGYHRLNRLNR